MADGDGGVLLQEHEGHGFAHDVAAANHNRVFAAQVVVNAFEHFHAAIRCAGPKARLPHHERTRAADMKTIHIFEGRNGFDHLVGIDVVGQGQLNQNAMNSRVLVEGRHAGQQLGLGQGGRVSLEHRMHAGVFAGLDLVAHIHLTGRVVAHQNHGQAGGDALGLEARYALRNLGAKLLRKGVTVDQLGRHMRKLDFLRGIRAKGDFEQVGHGVGP